jgi:hypothetical protein
VFRASSPSRLPYPASPLFSSILNLVLHDLLQVPFIRKFCLEMGPLARPTRSSKSTSNASVIVYGKKRIAEPLATPHKSQPKKRALEEDESEEDEEDLDTPTKPVLF